MLVSKIEEVSILNGLKGIPTASVRLFLSVESTAAHNKRNDIYPGGL